MTLRKKFSRTPPLRTEVVGPLEDIEKVDAELRAAGFDPDEVGKRMAAVAEGVLKQQARTSASIGWPEQSTVPARVLPWMVGTTAILCAASFAFVVMTTRAMQTDLADMALGLREVRETTEMIKGQLDESGEAVGASFRGMTGAYVGGGTEIRGPLVRPTFLPAVVQVEDRDEKTGDGMQQAGQLSKLEFDNLTQEEFERRLAAAIASGHATISDNTICLKLPRDGTSWRR